MVEQAGGLAAGRAGHGGHRQGQGQDRQGRRHRLRCSTSGNAWSTGGEFDASWNSGQPLEFPLGAGRVIPGWDQGIAGMKEGGRRLLVIPPDLAYGAQGAPPVIGPNETLVFVVDLEKVKG